MTYLVKHYQPGKGAFGEQCQTCTNFASAIRAHDAQLRAAGLPETTCEQVATIGNDICRFRQYANRTGLHGTDYGVFTIEYRG